ARFAEVGFRLLEPWPLKFVFDHIIGSSSKRGPDFFRALNSVDQMPLLALAAIAVVIITLLRAVASYWQPIGFAPLGNRALAKVRNQPSPHAQYVSLSPHR